MNKYAKCREKNHVKAWFTNLPLVIKKQDGFSNYLVPIVSSVTLLRKSSWLAAIKISMVVSNDKAAVIRWTTAIRHLRLLRRTCIAWAELLSLSFKIVIDKIAWFLRCFNLCSPRYFSAYCWYSWKALTKNTVGYFREASPSQGLSLITYKLIAVYNTYT